MKGRLGDKVRLQHVLDAIGEVETYVNGVAYEQFIIILKNDSPPLSKLRSLARRATR